ncbi:MAG: glycosyltransferase family 39 protein [Verrucomicrobia bacterium]|nr:glycosyltransferase family 39 protein [Verrucomicrobiota bacterium]
MNFRTAHLILFAVAALLALARLDEPAFWEDEAETAFVARAYLRTGEFSGWDGRNLHAYDGGTAMDAQLRYVNPPLQYAVTAASFKLLGVSTWTGRFPFVFCGLLALALFAVVLREEFREFPTLRLYAFAMMALSTSFFLYLRQCRYYSLALLFGLLAFYLYRHARRAPRWWKFPLLALAAAGLFYSHYLVAAAFLLALGATHLVFHARRTSREVWIGVAVTVVIFAALTLPFALSRQIWVRADMERGGAWWPGHATQLWWNLRDVNWLACLPWTMGLGLFWFLRRAREDENAPRAAWQWLALALAYLVFLALLGPNPNRSVGLADLRFFFLLTPFLAGLAGAFLWFVHQRSRLVSGALLVLITCSNLPALNPLRPRHRWLLPAYLAELSTPYPTAFGRAAEFLAARAQPGDTVFAQPHAMNFPLMFYAGDQVKFCGLLDEQTLLPHAALAKLDAPLWVNEHFPDWFVSFGWNEERQRWLNYFSRAHEHAGRNRQFRYEPVTSLGVYWYPSGRPELPWHTFGPVTDYHPLSQGVHIFRRVEVKKPPEKI